MNKGDDDDDLIRFPINLLLAKILQLVTPDEFHQVSEGSFADRREEKQLCGKVFHAIYIAVLTYRRKIQAFMFEVIRQRLGQFHIAKICISQDLLQWWDTFIQENDTRSVFAVPMYVLPEDDWYAEKREDEEIPDDAFYIRLCYHSKNYDFVVVGALRNITSCVLPGCDKPQFVMCGGCGKWYCSLEHKKKHRATGHKEVCHAQKSLVMRSFGRK